MNQSNKKFIINLSKIHSFYEEWSNNTRGIKTVNDNAKAKGKVDEENSKNKREIFPNSVR